MDLFRRRKFIKHQDYESDGCRCRESDNMNRATATLSAYLSFEATSNLPRSSSASQVLPVLRGGGGRNE